MPIEFAKFLIQDSKLLPLNMNTPLLQVNNINLTIQEKSILHNISFSLERGKTLALVGESGSGKSMTAMSILQLLPHNAKITSGEVIFDNTQLLSLSEKQLCSVRGNKLGIIFQEPNMSLNPVLTIGRQIGESITRHQGLKAKALKEKIIELLQEVKLPDPETRIDWYPHQLSGGQKQRVMIAIALACQPELLIADEPTTALDVSVQAQILHQLKELQQKRNLAILLITHDMGIVRQMSDHVITMKDGEILESQASNSFFEQPKHPYSQSLISQLPQIDKFRPPLEKIDNASPLLSVRNLSVRYPVRKGLLKRIVGYTEALKPIDFTLLEKETIAVVGESGSGKTTLGRAILRLLDNTAIIDGEINYQSHLLNKLSQNELRPLRKHFQIIFQDPYSSLNPRLSILQTLSEGMLALGTAISKKECQERAENLLEKVGLQASDIDRYPHEFSGGQRQRIAIARALSVEPKMIICDEPTSALDVSIRAQILQLLGQLQETMNLSLIFITHDLSLIPLIAHRVLVLKDGELIEQGDAKQIMQQPKQDYTKLLINSIPSLK